MSTITNFNQAILPFQYLAVMGGGQLGRMFCQSAQSMGYKTVVLDPIEQCPAAQVSDQFIKSAYDGEAGLSTLTQMAQAITTEFENVSAQSLQALSANSRVCPGAAAVAVVQDRIAEKAFISALDIPVAPHAAIRTQEDILNAKEELFPGIMKTARMGYDGKGQVHVKNRIEALAAFKELSQNTCILEALQPWQKEISVVLARNLYGDIAIYPAGENTHINGILSTTVVIPGRIEQVLLEQAQTYAAKIAQHLNYIGVLCVEFFVLPGQRLVANEIAPRPHNSGHYTMNACITSQFEQQVRAMAGLPLGATTLLSPAIMLNILGDSWLVDSAKPQDPDWASVLSLPGVSLHLYGKTQARKGRKMGHVNILGQDEKQLFATARKVSDILHLQTKL